MGSRIDLQKKLEGILNSKNVYFQPPPSIRMNYPAIVYKRKTIENEYADNGVYNQYYSYTVILIDKNPESDYIKALSMLPTCKHEQHYAKDNLNHDVFSLYY